MCSISVYLCIYSQTNYLSMNIFNTLSNTPAPTIAMQDELIMYYLCAPAKTTNNVIMWCINNHKNYPCLSQMALNYLSIPESFRYSHTDTFDIATSVHVE